MAHVWLRVVRCRSAPAEVVRAVLAEQGDDPAAAAQAAEQLKVRPALPCPSLGVMPLCVSTLRHLHAGTHHALLLRIAVFPKP